jgi:hypothetical protein
MLTFSEEYFFDNGVHLTKCDGTTLYSCGVASGRRDAVFLPKHIVAW